MSEESPRELTYRAIITGFVLGAFLVPCNVYSGLKIGFSFNMSIVAALLSYAFWNSLARFKIGKPIGLLENNINQTAASSAASIISAGLVAPIPALTLLEGRVLSWPVLSVWVFAVSFTGVVVALGVRRQMLLRERLPFPNGVATAETIREIYATGKEATYRLQLLLYGGLASGLLKLFVEWVYKIPSLSLPTSLGLAAPANLVAKGIPTVSWKNLGLMIDPSLLYIGFGMIVGTRVGVSLLGGTILAWCVLPWFLLEQGWALPGEASTDAFWYGPLLDWLLWPGVVLMAASALTSFAISVGRMAYARLAQGRQDDPEADDANVPTHSNSIPKTWFRLGVVLSLVLAVGAQMGIFDIDFDLAVGAFALTFLLAIVAARVSGETGIAPIGALGKITQVTFGLASPGNATVNLMAANVTGGAAGQCSDLLHDLKTGLLIRATLRHQAVAQLFGILSGSLFGTAVYLVIARDLPAMEADPDWAMPAVMAWKAVAELMKDGLEAMPPGILWACILAGLAGVGLAVLERSLPEARRKFVPSASSIGFAFIIPPAISIGLFLGALIGEGVRAIRADWKAKYLVIVAAGLVAGESLAGVADSIWILANDFF
ncbi:MAG: OPT family oligopeptide transporter [Opitutales bacterium]